MFRIIYRVLEAISEYSKHPMAFNDTIVDDFVRR